METFSDLPSVRGDSYGLSNRFMFPLRVLDARYSDNDWVQRARAVDSTQVKTADRGLRLQPFVTLHFWRRQLSRIVKRCLISLAEHIPEHPANTLPLRRHQSRLDRRQPNGDPLRSSSDPKSSIRHPFRYRSNFRQSLGHRMTGTISRCSTSCDRNGKISRCRSVLVRNHRTLTFARCT